MAKYKLQEMPDMNESGKRKVYPKMVINRTLSTKELVEKMKLYRRAFSPSIIEGVLMDLEDMLVDVLSMGYNVKLDGIGTFSLSIRSFLCKFAVENKDIHHFERFIHGEF